MVVFGRWEFMDGGRMSIGHIIACVIGAGVVFVRYMAVGCDRTGAVDVESARGRMSVRCLSFRGQTSCLFPSLLFFPVYRDGL